MSSTRQLAAIMSTDIVGYTDMMQMDEQKAVGVIKHYNATLEKWVAFHHGKVANYYGDGVNIASRIQSIAQENSILISVDIHDKIKNNTSFTTSSLGFFDFKNFYKPIQTRTYMKKLTALLRIVKSCVNLAAITCFPGDFPNRLSNSWYSRFPKSILLLSILFITTVSAYAQQSVKKDKDLVLEKVNQFFESLEKQDTNLYKRITLPGGQTWAVKEQGDSIRISMRSFEDRVKTFVNPAKVIQEWALDVEIKVHQQVAIAWVPYELHISGKFEHCGVDIFTLVKNKEGWKIVNVAFTMEPDGCDELKKQIGRDKK